MTWSLIARDADGSFGVAIASRFFAVGALCVHTRRAVGALATQALMNPLYGPAGIGLLADGVAVEEIVARLTASQYRGTDEVSICFFGDGSTNIGGFHEALNFASVWKLPVIFICENNLYGEYSPIATTTPMTELVDRADSYAMAKAQIDGNDILEVHATVGEAVARARAGEGPTFIEALTYRHKGHSRSDPAAYRPEGELEEWLKRDPILLHEQALLAAGVKQEALDALRAKAEQDVLEALERAQGWPDPTIESRLEHVYA